MISFSFIFNVSGSSFDALFGLGGVGGECGWYFTLQI